MEMKSKGLLLVVLLFLVAGVIEYGKAAMLNAPHDGGNSVTCNDCHVGALPDTDRSAICETCHDGDTAPFMRTHSYKAMNDSTICSGTCSSHPNDSCNTDTDCPDNATGEICELDNSGCPSWCSDHPDLTCTTDIDCPDNASGEFCDRETCIPTVGSRCSISTLIICAQDSDCPQDSLPVETCVDYYEVCSSVAPPSKSWDQVCLDCHDPHFQLQLGNYNASDFYIASGIINTVTPNVPAGFSTITYISPLPQVRSGWELPPHADDADWGAKSSTGRGLVLVAPADDQDSNFLKFTYEIDSADSATTTIIVNGIVTAVEETALEGQPFGIIYGQMIRTEVNGRPVVFTGPTTFAANDNCTYPGTCSSSGGVCTEAGGECPVGERCQPDCSAADDPADGICQVCHIIKTPGPQNPSHWLVNGTEANHYSHEDCSNCHQHESGFKGSGGDGPKHDLHKAMAGVSCVTCHGAYTAPLFADGKDLANTAACLQCHYSGAMNCGLECQTNFDCTSPDVCYNGNCYTGCLSDTDCSSPDICVNEVCTFVCETDTDCASGEVCESGTCYESCSLDADCAQGETCIDSKCSVPCPPNNLTYKANWHNVNFDMTCNGCHDGRLGYTVDESGEVTGAVALYTDKVKDTTATGWTPDDKWTGFYVKMTSGANKTELRKIVSSTSDTLTIEPFAGDIDNGDNYLIVHLNDVSTSCTPDCASCHDGGTQPVVGMQTNGHSRLASSKWVRQFDCYYCHSNTVDTNWNINPVYHMNGDADAVVNDEWKIVNQPLPHYTGDTPTGNEEPYSCYNSYCHSDGTTENPEIREYSWFGGKEACNSCHGHAPDIGGCDAAECHPTPLTTPPTPPRTGTYWDNFPEKKWLSAMPMYRNEGVLTDKANSHYRHMFTGFSCDDCHFDTIEGGGCLTCHQAGIPAGDMAETAHINAAYHVNRNKDVVFKRLSGEGTEGSYDPITKKCSNTYCHTGSDPQWGGSVYDAIVCRDCHGSVDGDFDDFGKFNDERARIDTTQWNDSGHGRQLLKDGNGDPIPDTNPYPSGNPPAQFPDNGCWYCHDSTILHMDEDRPFRLIQHDHFNRRFEKECVFCHMVEDSPGSHQYREDQCLNCHNDPTGETLAPQLNNTPTNHASTDPNDELGHITRMNVCDDCHRICDTANGVDPGENPACMLEESCSDRQGLGAVCTETPNPEYPDHYADCGTCHAGPDPTFWDWPDHREFNETATLGTIGGQASCAAAGCHDSNESRHNVDSEVWWNQDQVDDAKNAYLQMGVCLKCHDDDAGNQCTACHLTPRDKTETPNIDESLRYALGFDPAEKDPVHFEGKTAGRIVPQIAKAASFHFGHLHERDYEDSLGNTIDSGTVTLDLGGSCEVDADCSQGQSCVFIDEAKVCDRLFTARMLTDTSKDWKGIDSQTGEIYELTGRSVTLTINSGPLAGEQRTRSIVRVDDDLSDTLIVSPSFFTTEEGEIQHEGDTYELVDVVWKGGKFCWDCHDPHGDTNIYMIQDEIATRTDGLVGKPIEQAATSFTRKSSGLDYVSDDEDPIRYQGLCNVCHSAGQHYTKDSEVADHNSGRVCTECHEHRFTNSHASGQECGSCHANRPVPRHTAFGQSRDCTKCHKDAIGNRMNVMTQFEANSHHVQAGEVTNKHCYACHWEATESGTINLEYHEGYNFSTFETTSDAKVDLVVWTADDNPNYPGDDNEPTKGSRPYEYNLVEGPGNPQTAVKFYAGMIDVGTTFKRPDEQESPFEVTLNDQRGQVDEITVHCLGCHSDKNNDTKPFDVVDPDNTDCKTPRQYAWDNSSIDARYSNTDITTWGKDSGANVAEKDITKAFSAHGNAVAGGGGWDKDEDGTGPDTADGVDDVIPNTRGGAYNVQCFDCHSSHGSEVGLVTSSYVTFNGTMNGGNLKETQGGKGGYSMTYRATANPISTSVNPYEAGAGQCFDCHETAMAKTQISPVSKSPWGYSETFGATEPVIGYKDNPRFEGSYPGDGFDYRSGKATVGGHFNASSDLTKPVMGTIDGLCTPCHDPHGISPTLGSKMAYSVPLLKGTYMSSPYKEDAPPMTGDGYSSTDGFYNRYNGWTGSFVRPYPQKADPQPSGVWRTDRNTFNTADLSLRASHPDDYGSINEEADLFAGLCLNCHPKSSLTTEASVEPTDSIAFKTRDRIHRSVKGWGIAEGEEEREHAFTCSKCHQPHASGLPRLMQTNCLNYAHRGQVPFGGRPDTATSGSHRYEFGRFPSGWTDTGAFTAYSTAICHGAPTANGSTGWPDNQRWNEVTPWEEGGP